MATTYNKHVLQLFLLFPFINGYFSDSHNFPKPAFKPASHTKLQVKDEMLEKNNFMFQIEIHLRVKKTTRKPNVFVKTQLQKCGLN